MTLAEILSQIAVALKAIAKLEKELNFQKGLPETSTMRVGAEKLAQMQQQLTRWREELATLRKAEELAARTAQAVGTGSSSGGSLLGVFTRIGSWFGLEGTAATLAGVAAVTIVLGGVTYGIARFAGSRAGDEPVHAGLAMRQRPDTNQSSTSKQPAGPSLPATGTTRGDPTGTEPAALASVVEKWIYRDYDKKAGKDMPGGYTTTFQLFKDGTAKAADGGTGNIISNTDSEIKIQVRRGLYKYTITWNPQTAIGQILFSDAPDDSPKKTDPGPYDISMRRN
jgi:hypothetical protein